MARPERRDVDYFPFFAKRGKTLNILQSKYGLEGIGFFTNLMRFLALTPDHHYCINDEINRMNFFAEVGIKDEERGIEMIELMVKTEKLDKNLWEKYKVIVCPVFLESIKDAYSERKNPIITLEEITNLYEFPPEKQRDNSNVAGFPPHFEEFPPEKQRDNPQSKVKETKEFSGSTAPQKEKPFALLSREPKNDLERVNKKWLENYIKLFGSQPINPRWDISSPLIKSAIKQAGVEKVLQALDNAVDDKFCNEAGYTLKVIMSGNVISRLINSPPRDDPPERASYIPSAEQTDGLLAEQAKNREKSINGDLTSELKKIMRVKKGGRL